MKISLLDKYFLSKQVRILIISDKPHDALIIKEEIRRIFDSSLFKSLDNKENFIPELEKFKPDLIISEIRINGFSIEDILSFSVNKKNPVPLIIFTSRNNEDEALKYLGEGAFDCVIKEQSKRFTQTIIRALEWKQMKREISFAERDLNEYQKYINQYRRWEANVPAMAYLFVLDKDGNQSFRYVSPASKTLFGLQPEEIVKDITSIASRIHPDDIPALQEAVMESATALTPFKHQVRHLVNGEVRWYDYNSLPQREPNGDVVWDGVMMDITGWKNAQEAFIAEHNLLLTLMDYSPDAIYFKDLESRFIKVNKGYLTKFNLKENDVNGKTDFDLFSPEHANEARNDELEIIRTGTAIIDKVEKEEWAFEKRTWVSTSKMPLRDNKGNITGTFGISRDITERKNAEEKIKSSEARLRYLISSTSAILYSLKISGNQAAPIWIGDNVKDLLGYIPEEVLEPGWWENTLHPDDKEYVNSIFPSLFENNKLIFEYRLKHKEGHYVWLIAELILVRDPDGKPLEIFGSWVDITERMMAQEALLASEAQLSYALKIAKLAHWEYDVKDDLLILNDQFYSLLHTSAEKEGGYTMSSGHYAERFVHPDDRMIIGLEIQKGIETKDPSYNRYLEHRVIYADGETGYFSVRFFISKDQQGNTIKAFGVDHDITERKRADEALRASEERYRYLVNNAEFPVIVSSLKNGKVLFANEYAISYFKLQSKDAVGEVAPNYWCNPDDRKQFISLLLNDGRVTSFEAELNTVGGEKRWALLSANIILFENEKASFTVFSDITARKHAEEALSTSEYFLRKSQSVARVGSFKFVFKTGKWENSKTLDEILGIDINYPKTILGWAKTIHLSHRNEIISYLKNQVFLKKGRFEKEYMIIRKSDGKERWILGIGDLEFDTDGNPIALIGTAQDITERILREQEKQELEKQIKQRNKELEKTLYDLKRMQSTLVQTEKMVSLGQLSAGIAHEINNPLAFVSSNINRLKEYFKDTVELLQKWQSLKSEIPVLTDNSNFLLQEIDEFTKEIDLDFILQDFEKMMISIQDGTQRIKKIVEGMRGFTHLAESSFSEVDINQAIEETLTIVWNEIKYKATIEKNYGDLPKITCNVVEIKQVLVNLIVNATHAIEEKGNISLSTSNDNDYIHISIKDSGCGIPKEKIKKIFDPFYTTKEVGKGTGLGLWISSSIIEKHSGTITVESELGVGSTFTVKLPVKQNLLSKAVEGIVV